MTFWFDFWSVRIIMSGFTAIEPGRFLIEYCGRIERILLYLRIRSKRYVGPIFHRQNRWPVEFYHLNYQIGELLFHSSNFSDFLGIMSKISQSDDIFEIPKFKLFWIHRNKVWIQPIMSHSVWFITWTYSFKLPDETTNCPLFVALACCCLVTLPMDLKMGLDGWKKRLTTKSVNNLSTFLSPFLSPWLFFTFISKFFSEWREKKSRVKEKWLEIDSINWIALRNFQFLSLKFSKNFKVALPEKCYLTIFL